MGKQKLQKISDESKTQSKSIVYSGTNASNQTPSIVIPDYHSTLFVNSCSFVVPFLFPMLGEILVQATFSTVELIVD
jgi:hypothetical protein